MVTVLVTSFLLLAAISYAFYCRQRASSKEDADGSSLMPPRFHGLFGDMGTIDAPAASRAGVKTGGLTSEERARLRERAALNDKAALIEAQARSDAALYDELLNALVEQADSDKKLLALVSYVTRHEGSCHKRLAERLSNPGRHNSRQKLDGHDATRRALSDDAALYHTVETALHLARKTIPNLSAEELRTLAESEYWLLSAGVRSSGAGFVLKQKLAGLRRELAAAIESIQ